MKYSRILSCFLILIFTLVFTPQAIFAAPPPQSGTDGVIQIVLVLDVSGSMGTPVYSGIVPEDLLSLLLRMDELQNDPEFRELNDQLEEADKHPDVLETKNDWLESYDVFTDWITSNQGIVLPGIQSSIRTILNSAGCDDSSDFEIATAGDTEQIDFYIDSACSAGSISNQERQEIKDLVPYILDPRYQEPREEWLEAFRLYNEALELSGYESYSQQLEDYKASSNYQEIQDEIDRLVEVYNIPSRLELAKSAAINLIDLSQLYKENTGRESAIGLVTFSNQAMFEHALTLEYSELEPLIRSMVPLHQTNIGDALSLGLDELANNADPDQPMLVILLSDGHANVGMSSSEILSVIPPRANSLEVTLCTAGFADIEAEVDFVLLEGLAEQTEGEYIFTNRGAELGSFFVACREGRAGKDLAGQITGIIDAGDIKEIGRVEIENNTCDLSLALNFLSGMPMIELIDPDGETIDPANDGITYQASNQVQLLSVDHPVAGEWVVSLSNDDNQGMDSAFSILISTTPCEGPQVGVEPMPVLEIPYLLSDEGMPVVTGGTILLVVILAIGTGFVILVRQRRSE